MVSVLTEPEAVETPEPEYDPSIADESLLEDKFPEWFRLPAAAAGLVLLMSVTYFVFNLKPLWHTDLWGHLSYGRLIWQTGSLPETEPLMALSEGVPFVDSAWLSQLIGYGAHVFAGKVGVAFLYAASIALALGLLLHRIYDRSRSGLFASLAFGLLLWIEWKQLAIVRPQIAGFLLFCGLLSTLLKRKWSKANWVLIPGMMALWANLHGSFIVGLGLLACFVAGRAIDILRRTGKPRALLHDGKLRRWFLVTEIAAVAALINPYGLGLYAEVLSFGGNGNLQSIIEWQELSIRMMQGKAAAAAVILLFVVYRISPRRVTTFELLSLAIFGLGAMWSSRLLLWWGPLAVCLAAIHGCAGWRRLRRVATDYEPATRTSMWTIVCFGVAMIFFGLSFMGMVTLRMALNKNPEQVINALQLSDQTPVDAVRHLNEHPPEGLVFNTYEWGDYLTWAGPKDMQVFVTSHAHLVPSEVWNDYMGVIRMRSGWESLLERYAVNTVVLDENLRSSMIQRFRESPDWRLSYKDSTAAVFRRRNPI